jgi:hypothetical protein
MRTEDETRQSALKQRVAHSELSLPPEVARLTRAVMGWPDPPLTCETCRMQLPAYVDAEVGGLPVAQRYPDVKHHLDGCTDCGASYLALLQLALTEEAAPWPIPDRTSAPDLSFLPPLTLAEVVRALAQEIVTAIAPNLIGELHTIADFFFERVATLKQPLKFGPNAAPALGFGAGDTPEALKLLAATYAATQALISDRTAHDIEDQAQHRQLTATSQAEAQAAARDMRLSAALAQRFAQQYAQLADREARTLQQLATRRS